MIEKKEENGEKFLSVEQGPGEERKTAMADFKRAFDSGLPIEAPLWMGREFGFPDEQEDVGSTEDVIAAGRDPYEL